MVASAATAQSFGKYTLVAKLATGGMAEIFLARLSGAAGFEKLVCIKRILPHLAKDQALVGMFLAEAKIAAQISHHNVCGVFELGEIDGRYFIAMEYLEGVPVSCFRRRDMYPPPPDPRLVAGLGVQACEGLHHAHQLKKSDGTLMEVVHRDVSANNLFATVDGVVKVLDFGIAKVQDASVRTSTGSVKGTYAYMAPEQLRGERLDRRTDVFALGIVLWELFARKHLFKRDTDFLTFQAITTDPIPDVSEFRPDVPPALSDAIAKALTRDRDMRFPSARAFGEALAQSVIPLGGALSASAISDVIAGGFSERLQAQRNLIKIAREGGALDLTDDLGPGVGHGTAMITTPVSMLSSPEISAIPAPVPSPAARRSVTIDVPALTQRSRALPIVIAFLVVMVAGIVLFFVLGGDDTKPQVVTTTPDAAVAKISIDAAAIRVTPDTAIVVEIDAMTVPLDAAVAVELDAGTPVNTPDAGTPKPQPPKPTGPPGSVTIDSSPVYAVIFIDGRRYSETPLVGVRLAPGRHVVRAVTASGASQTRVVQIESGRVAPTVRFHW